MAEILSLITAFLSGDRAALEAAKDPRQAQLFLAWLARSHDETIAPALAPALWRLRAVARGLACGCELYPGSGRFDPRAEQEEGHVEILQAIVKAKEYHTVFTCCCTTCGRLFNVSDEPGPQRASYHWQEIPTPSTT